MQYLHQPIEVKAFEDLTLFEYIQLFKKLWPKYQEAFNHLEWQLIGELLEEVRKTRNAIAHFREVTTNQRTQLKFCASFLERHRPSLKEANEPTEVVIAIDENDLGPCTSTSTEDQLCEMPEKGFTPTEEELGPNESRYAPLALWLQEQVEEGLGKVALTFEQVETIIDDKLPPSARQHRNWWANDSVGHTQSQQWLDVGWRVSNVNISEERVVFSRIDDRQEAYIHFFNTLLPKLKEIQGVTVEPAMNSQGRHWFTVVLTSQDVKEPTWLTCCFARRSRFRIELYIETGNRDTNKQLFDQMYSQKTLIEAELGEPLQWERLDTKRGARIALYREKASITQSPEQLSALQDWAVKAMERFYYAVAKRFQDVKSEVMSLTE
ncbi:MAG TPA: DUF4268 domain-containing protein [Leptolyngbyaceae cyanobacterium M33_DOE_097]|nr:DUF4268 domain-containing protein [Leptolyngbyaceae cyanobacterium M33_DOE_097]